MPLTRLKRITAVQHSGQRLDDMLVHWLTEELHRPFSKAKVRKLIMAGGVYLQGRPIRIAAQSLPSGVVVRVAVDIERLFSDATAQDRPFEVTTDHVLFEDDDLIAIDKPPGLPAQPTVDETRNNLFGAVRRFIGTRDGVESPYIGMHQRLDRDTSGVVLFTKSQRVNAAVAEIFSRHQGTKIYHALTVPWPASGRTKRQQQWTIRNYLGPVGRKANRRRFGAVPTGGLLAETSFRVLAEYRRGCLIEAIPRTGRTHQIRVHLSECGLPILGDDLYGMDNPRGKRQVVAPRLMLHAARLLFPHPVKGTEVLIESPRPADFEQCVRRLQAE